MPGSFGHRWRLGLVGLLAVTVLLAVRAGGIEAQEPPPAAETPATEAGLGPCRDTMRVGVLNDDWNTLPEDLVKRHGNGGFKATIVTNCKPVSINFYVVDLLGARVPHAEGQRQVHESFDDIEWLDIGEIEYECHTTDVYEDGALKYAAGPPILDHNGNSIPIPRDDEAVTAYRYTLEFDNEQIDIGGENRRPMVAEQDYGLIFEVVPFDGAPPSHIHEFTFEVIAKIGGQWWDKLLRIATPTYWIEKACNFVIGGIAQAVMGGMCTITSRFMTKSQIVALDRYDSDGDGRLTVDDDFVENAGDPAKPNGNGYCKRPQDSPEEELKEIRTAAYIQVNERRAIAGLPPIGPRPEGEYVRDLMDGREPAAPTGPIGDGIAYRLEHLTLAPRVVMNKVGLAPPRAITGGGITTFTGLLTGTPPELTYERGIVRLGWSAMMNVMVSVLGLMIAWIGLTQIIRSFTGNQRGMADWRELIPRLLLAILAALTSYWWCSLLVDLADGVSRYIAATMRVTPADITLTLGQAVLAVVVRSAGAYALGFIPFAGILAIALKLLMNFLISVLMITYSLMLLMMIGQFVLRIVMINLMIILSPLGMIMWALPETASWGHRWVKEFEIALLTHGLQLVCFALSTWFIREATPVGVVFDTGSFPSALQSLLPTQMIWALALGTMAAYLTTKIPAMLGSNVYEGFQSLFAMAAVGALALGAGPGGAGKVMGMFGGGGSGSGGGGPLGSLSTLGVGRNNPAGAGLMAVMGLGNTATTAAMQGLGRGGRSLIQSAITGVKGNIGGGAPAPSQAAGGIPSPGGVAPQVSAGSTAASALGRIGVQQPISGRWASMVRRAQTSGSPSGARVVRQASAGIPSQASVGASLPQASVGTPSPQTSAWTPPPQYESPLPPRPEGMNDAERLASTMPPDYTAQGVRAMNENYIQSAPGAPPRPTTSEERGLIHEMGADRFNAASRVRRMQSVLPPGYTGQGVSAVNANTVREGSRTRAASPVERGLINEMGVRGFNRGMQEFASSGGVPVPQGAQPYQPSAAEYSRVRSGMTPENFQRGQQSRMRAMDSSGMRVADGGRTRMATPSERHLIRGVGMEAFNSVMQGRRPVEMDAQPLSGAADQGDASGSPPAAADSARALNTLGISGGDIQGAQRAGLKALTPNYVMEGGRLRPASSEERGLIDQIGMNRFNRVFAPPAAPAPSRASQIASPIDSPARPTDAAAAGVLGDAAQRQEQASPRGFMAGMRSAMSEAVTEGRSGLRESLGQGAGAGVRQIEDIRTGRVSAETADGESARDILGPEEYERSSGRAIRFEQEGSWVSEGGRIVNMETDQGRYMASARRVREAMGDDDAFSHFMQNDIRIAEGTHDPDTGVPFISENPTATDQGLRSATPAEISVMRVAGNQAFSTAGEGRREFLGDRALVRDEGTRRMATEGETQLYQNLGQVRFNDVMNRRVEDAGFDASTTQQSSGGAGARGGGEAGGSQGDSIFGNVREDLVSGFRRDVGRMRRVGGFAQSPAQGLGAGQAEAYQAAPTPFDAQRAAQRRTGDINLRSQNE